MSEKDDLYRQGAEDTEPFVFDERVVKVFPDMIGRSVPGYGLIVPMLGLLARRHARSGTNIYDLGCSLGAATRAMRTAIGNRQVHFIAVDNSPAMVARCREVLADEDSSAPVEVRLANIEETDIVNASVVALNFTLQFIDPSGRQALLERIADGLLPGGALLLAEKIRFDDDAEEALQVGWHHDFKKARGYSELEIAGKRAALEKVLRPDTESEHRARLQRAGFRRVTRWFQCFNFAAFLAER